MTIGENIRRIRQEKNYTQKQLGARCGIDDANIRKYELGKANPKLETLRRIAAALGVYINDLVDDWGVFSKEEIEEDWNNRLNPKENHLLNNYRKLNPIGQDKAVDQVELLTKIPEYQKKE